MKIRYLLITLIMLFLISCNSSKVKKEINFRNTIATSYEKVSYNITNKYVDTLLINSKHYDEITIFINKPNFYNIVNTRKFEPLYIFSNNKILSEQYINSNIQSPFSAEAFIYILVDLDFDQQNSSKFSDFLKAELFPLIEKKYRCFDIRYTLSENQSTKVISDILNNQSAIFDFYLFIQPNNIALTNLNGINNIKSKTFKSINVIQLDDNHREIKSISNSESITINNYVINEHTENDNELSKQIKKLSSKIINQYNKSIANIEEEFYDDDFAKGDSIINILENYSNQKIKLITPRNTNALAYNIQSYGHNELSIKIINWSIEKFPENLNLYHSKGELYFKIGDMKKAQIAYNDFKDVINLNKDNLEKSTFEYYLRLYEKSINRTK